jgi:hypothetical protein
MEAHMDEWARFLLGTALAIPLSVLATVLAPKIQEALETFGRDAALKKRVRATEAQYEYDRIRGYKQSPSDFTQYLVYVGIKIAFVSAALGIISGIAFIIGSLLGPALAGGFAGAIPYAVGQLAALVGTLIILNIARSALRTWTQVKNFDEYERRVKELVQGQ